jgi:hypothetical protein
VRALVDDADEVIARIIGGLRASSKTELNLPEAVELLLSDVKTQGSLQASKRPSFSRGPEGYSPRSSGAGCGTPVIALTFSMDTGKAPFRF